MSVARFLPKIVVLLKDRDCHKATHANADRGDSEVLHSLTIADW